MRTAFHDMPLFKHDDLVAVADRGQPVGDHDTGDAAVLDSFHQFIFGFGVQSAGRLVQNDNGRILRQNPGNLQALPLSAGQVPAVFDQPALVSSGPLQDIVMNLRVAGGNTLHGIVFAGLPSKRISPAQG